MKIEITRRVGGHDAGTTLDLPESQANHLIANGYAIEVKSAKNASAKADDEPKVKVKATAKADDEPKAEAKSATVKRGTKPRVDAARATRKTGRDGASDTAEGA